MSYTNQTVLTRRWVDNACWLTRFTKKEIMHDKNVAGNKASSSSSSRVSE